MNKEMATQDPEAQLKTMRDALEAARRTAHRMYTALQHGLTDEAELEQLASDTLASIDMCLTLETISDLARRELTRRVLAGEHVGGDTEAKLLN